MMLLKTMSRVREGRSVEEIARAAADLKAQANERGENTKRFSRWAWVLEALGFFLAGLVFIGVPLLTPGDGADALQGPLAGFLKPLSGMGTTARLVLAVVLLLLPLASDVVFARMSRSVSAQGDPAEIKNELSRALPGRLRYIENSLDWAERDLRYDNVDEMVPLLCHALSLLFALGEAWVLTAGRFAEGFFEGVLYLAAAAAVSFVILEVIVLAKHLLMLELFSSTKDGALVKELQKQFIQTAKRLCPEYLSYEEEKRKERREKEQAEAERRRKAEKYLREHPVTVDWRDVRDRMERNEAAAYSSSFDHDELDAAQGRFRNHDSSGWLDDI